MMALDMGLWFSQALLDLRRLTFIAEGPRGPYPL